MIARTLIILTTLLPIVLAGQTFKGKLEMDSITGQYSYKTDCDDKLIITGEHMPIRNTSQMTVCLLPYIFSVLTQLCKEN